MISVPNIFLQVRTGRSQMVVDFLKQFKLFSFIQLLDLKVRAAAAVFTVLQVIALILSKP